MISALLVWSSVHSPFQILRCCATLSEIFHQICCNFCMGGFAGWNQRIIAFLLDILVQYVQKKCDFVLAGRASCNHGDAVAFFSYSIMCRALKPCSWSCETSGQIAGLILFATNLLLQNSASTFSMYRRGSIICMGVIISHTYSN